MKRRMLWIDRLVWAANLLKKRGMKAYPAIVKEFDEETAFKILMSCFFSQFGTREFAELATSLFFVSKKDAAKKVRKAYGVPEESFDYAAA